MDTATDPTIGHSKLPWRLESHGRTTSIRCPSSFHDHIESCPDLGDPANAALIVRAVNSHAALVAAASRVANGPADPQPGEQYTFWMHGEEIVALRAALKLARGEA